jgi:hypothetical protein
MIEKVGSLGRIFSGPPRPGKAKTWLSVMPNGLLRRMVSSR